MCPCNHQLELSRNSHLKAQEVFLVPFLPPDSHPVCSLRDDNFIRLLHTFGFMSHQTCYVPRGVWLILCLLLDHSSLDCVHRTSPNTFSDSFFYRFSLHIFNCLPFLFKSNPNDSVDKKELGLRICLFEKGLIQTHN